MCSDIVIHYQQLNNILWPWQHYYCNSISEDRDYTISDCKQCKVYKPVGHLSIDTFSNGYTVTTWFYALFLVYALFQFQMMNQSPGIFQNQNVLVPTTSEQYPGIHFDPSENWWLWQNNINTWPRQLSCVMLMHSLSTETCLPRLGHAEILPVNLVLPPCPPLFHSLPTSLPSFLSPFAIWTCLQSLSEVI